MNFLVARKSVMIMCARVCVHFGERGGTEGGRKREGWETEREGESMRIRECLLGGGGGGGGRREGLPIRKFKPISLQVSTR